VRAEAFLFATGKRNELDAAASRRSSIPERLSPSSSSCPTGQCDLPEPLHQEEVPLGVLDSREEKSMAVRREVGSPEGE
jgi:hypothetical protein